MDFKKNILEKILFQIKNNPLRLAFCINENYFTYSDFGILISKIRGVLKKSHSNEGLIALEVNDDLLTYASIIALWLEGKGFVSIHPDYPLDRTYEIINQTDVKSIITSNNDLNLKSINKVKLEFSNEKTDDLNTKEISESKIAYILFTSGSTGKPKGVVIKRYNIGQFFSSFWQSGINLDSNDKCLQCFDLTFDVSIQTFYFYVLTGDSLCPINNANELFFVQI